jgi:hypothetical protein
MLDNIIYARAFTTEHQDALITLSAAKMVQLLYLYVFAPAIKEFTYEMFCLVGRGKVWSPGPSYQKFGYTPPLAKQFTLFGGTVDCGLRYVTVPS